jgi:hypothetical protein
MVGKKAFSFEETADIIKPKNRISLIVSMSVNIQMICSSPVRSWGFLKVWKD